MSASSPSLALKVGVSLLAVVVGAGAVRAQLGVVIAGQGAVNSSMGGASTAQAVDATGALYWNPATSTGLGRSEMEFGVEELYPQTRVSSTVTAGALGPNVPARTLSGADNGENGLFTLPSFGCVYAPEDSNWVFGLGVFAAGGFGVNYQASIVNPIFAKPPFGVGQGALYTQYQELEIAPTAAYRITDRLSAAVGPTLSMGLLQADPGVIAPPNVAADGTAVYPALTHTRYNFGGGFQVGLTYLLDDDWRLGASFKSPQWSEPFRYHSADANGLPRTDTFHLDFPMIVSTGVAYSGFDGWLLAGDLRYIDYHDTTGFRASGFAPNGALRGLGWNSIFAVALGAEYRPSDCTALRAGYTFNQNPIADSEAFANVGAATVEEHGVYLGASYRLSEALALSVAYEHFFGNSVEGPLLTPRGPVPGTSVKDEVTGVDSLVLGLSVQFGARK